MNNKGGCGKTSSSIALGIYLARAGFNVLFIDCDSQCNLSQRLGISDDMFPDRRLMEFFRNIEDPNFIIEQKELPINIHYRYLYRLAGSDTKPGNIALLAGSQFAEGEAGTAQVRLYSNTTLDYEQRQISKRFRAAVRSYLTHFDYIIMDTAPALEGSLLCQLALQASDEIICPVDGLEAALGLQHVISWLDMQSSPSYGIVDKPNVTFALTKYYTDDGETKELIEGYPINNAVFRAMKDVLGTYVCDNGIMEDADKKNRVYQVYGRKTDYEGLCEEIYHKINKTRDNFFETWNRDTSNRLRTKLRHIEGVTLNKKKPGFKDITYQTKKAEQDRRSDKTMVTENVDMGPGHAESVGFDL
jgi:cellulose biosynthesis protein BcsQ